MPPHVVIINGLSQPQAGTLSNVQASCLAQKCDQSKKVQGALARRLRRGLDGLRKVEAYVDRVACHDAIQNVVAVLRDV